MNISGKIWGHTSLLFAANNVEVHRIQGIQGGFSSTHKHNSKFSMFIVEQGRVKISVTKNDYDLVDETILTAGQSTIIPPGEFHKFEMLSDAVCYEIYWVTLDPKDIIRLDCGHLKSADQS